VQGESAYPVQDLQAVRAGGVRDHLAVPQRSGPGEPVDHGAQRVVRHREQQQIGGGPGDLVGRSDGGLRQQAGGPLHRGRGDCRGGDDLVPGGGERGAQHRTDASRADHTHHQRVRVPAGALQCAHVQIQSS
jgi:hypothetical protein